MPTYSYLVEDTRTDRRRLTISCCEAPSLGAARRMLEGKRKKVLSLEQVRYCRCGSPWANHPICRNCSWPHPRTVGRLVVLLSILAFLVTVQL